MSAFVYVAVSHSRKLYAFKSHVHINPDAPHTRTNTPTYNHTYPHTWCEISGRHSAASRLCFFRIWAWSSQLSSSYPLPTLTVSRHALSSTTMRRSELVCVCVVVCVCVYVCARAFVWVCLCVVRLCALCVCESACTCRVNTMQAFQQLWDACDSNAFVAERKHKKYIFISTYTPQPKNKRTHTCLSQLQSWATLAQRPWSPHHWPPCAFCLPPARHGSPRDQT